MIFKVCLTISARYVLEDLYILVSNKLIPKTVQEHKKVWKSYFSLDCDEEKSTKFISY